MRVPRTHARFATLLSASTPEQTTQASAIQQCGDYGLLQLTSLENFAMLIASLLILLAGAGISVCDFYSSALNSYSYTYSLHIHLQIATESRA